MAQLPDDPFALLGGTASLPDDPFALLGKEESQPQASSSSSTPDAGYDYSRHQQREQPSEIPEQVVTRQEADPTPEMRNVPVGAVDNIFDWMKGVGKAMKASNPTLAGKLAQTTYNMSMEKAVEQGMPSEVLDMAKREKAFNQEKLLQDVSTAQQIAGEVAGMVADPVALATQSWGLKTAPGLARILKMATAGGAYSGTYETMDQLAEDGRITDPLAIAAYTAVGTVLPPAIDKGFRVARRVVDKATLRSLEKYTKQNIADGQNQRAAFNSALTRMGLDKDTVSEIVDGNGMQEVYADTIAKWQKGRTASKAAMKLDGYVDASKATNGIWLNAKNKMKGAMDYLGEARDDIIEPISSGIRKISPELFGAIRRFEYNTHKDSNAWRTVVAPAQAVYNKFSKVEKEVFKKAARNRETEVAEALYRKHGGAEGVAAYRSVRGVLDDIYEQMTATGVEINYLEKHWPMYLKREGGYDQLAEHMGWDPKSTWELAMKQKGLAKGQKADINNEIARLEKKYNRVLTKDELDHVKAQVKLWEQRSIPPTEKEKADFFNSELKGIVRQGLRTPTAAKGRVIERVTDDMLPYIEDPFINLMSYIDHSAHTINTRKFFGKGLDGDPNGVDEKSIGSFVANLKDKGEIRRQDEQRLKSLINARFNYKPTDKVTRVVKNIFYATKLGQLDSAATQLADLGTSAFVNGLRNTLVGAFRPKLPKALDEIQVRKIAQELETSHGTAQAIQDFALKASLFQGVDRLGKKVFVEGALRKNMNAVNGKRGALLGQTGGKNLNAFRTKWEPVFGKETDSLIGDLQAGRMTDNVKFMLFNELSDVQPISLLEVPKVYLNSPGGRTFYAMKSFTLKQIDLFRREALSKMLSGNASETAEGFGRMLKYGAVMTLANQPVDQLKNWMSGREVDMTDVQWTTLMKNFGISPYLARQWEQANDRDQSVAAATIDYLLSNPYIGVAETLEAAGKDLANFGERFESSKDVIPVVGKMYYNLFGGGAEKIMEQEKKKFMSSYDTEMGTDPYADYK